MHETRERIFTNGLRLSVLRHRDEGAAPSGLSVLLLHGYMDAAATWDRVAVALARAGHDVVTPDLRGFGESDRIGAGGYYHFPDYVADVAGLVDALAPARLAIVGHSMGGTIASLFTGTFPDRVERLALLEGFGPMAMDASLGVDRMRAWLRDMKRVARADRPLSSLAEAVERLRVNHARVRVDVLEEMATKLTRRDAEGRLVWAFDPVHRTTSPSLFQTDVFRAFLAQIGCPVLCVSGGPLGWHPPDEEERIAALRDARRVELRDAGHMMHWTMPDELARCLVAFLGEPRG